jgi:hypothetical protein
MPDAVDVFDEENVAGSEHPCLAGCGDSSEPDRQIIN